VQGAQSLAHRKLGYYYEMMAIKMLLLLALLLAGCAQEKFSGGPVHRSKSTLEWDGKPTSRPMD